MPTSQPPLDGLTFCYAVAVFSFLAYVIAKAWGKPPRSRGGGVA